MQWLTTWKILPTDEWQEWAYEGPWQRIHVPDGQRQTSTNLNGLVCWKQFSDTQQSGCAKISLQNKKKTRSLPPFMVGKENQYLGYRGSYIPYLGKLLPKLPSLRRSRTRKQVPTAMGASLLLRLSDLARPCDTRGEWVGEIEAECGFWQTSCGRIKTQALGALQPG